MMIARRLVFLGFSALLFCAASVALAQSGSGAGRRSAPSLPSAVDPNAPQRPPLQDQTGGQASQDPYGKPQNPNACENRAQASAGVLDLVDKITDGLIDGRLKSEAASAGMKRLVAASQRLNKDDVRGACAIVRTVRNQYRFAAKAQ